MQDLMAWGSELWLWLLQILTENIALTKDNTLPTIANVVGYISVIAVGMWGYRAVERRLRKEHTVDILLRLWITSDFSEGLHILDNHIAKDLYVVEDRLKEDDGAESSKSLDMLMNFYEFVAVTLTSSAACTCPLTREKMQRKEHNRDRRFQAPRRDLKVAA